MTKLYLGCDIGLVTNSISILKYEKSYTYPIIVYAKCFNDNILKSYDLGKRLEYNYQNMYQVLGEHRDKLDKIAYEHPVMSTKTGHHLSMVAGLLLLACNQLGLEKKVLEYSAQHIKKDITGYGKSSKDSIKNSMEEYLGIKLVKHNNHVVDSLACAYTAMLEDGLYERPIF